MSPTLLAFFGSVWLVGAAGQQTQPTSIRLLVAKLDQVIEKAVTSRGVGHEPSLKDARAAVSSSNLLADPVEVTVVIHSVEPHYAVRLIRAPSLLIPTIEEDGKLITGHTMARSKPLSAYRSAEEQERIVKFNEYTQNREARYRNAPKGVARMQEASHERWREERRTEYGELMRSIDARAEERKRVCETIAVELHLPAAVCVTVDTARLGQAASAKITAQLRDVGIREGHKDLDAAPSVGSIVGQVLAVDSRFDPP